MKALIRFVHVYGEPIRVRLTPQPETDADVKWILEATDGKGCLTFDLVNGNSLLIANSELADILARTFCERMPVVEMQGN